MKHILPLLLLPMLAACAGPAFSPQQALRQEIAALDTSKPAVWAGEGDAAATAVHDQERLEQLLQAAMSYVQQFPQAQDSPAVLQVLADTLLHVHLNYPELTEQSLAAERVLVNQTQLPAATALPLYHLNLLRLQRDPAATPEAIRDHARSFAQRFPDTPEAAEMARLTREPIEARGAEAGAASVATHAAHLPGTTESGPAAGSSEAEAPLALAFTAVDGRVIDLADLRGKVVLIDFWATWCGPCLDEVPYLKAAYDQYHTKGFEILGVSLDTDQQRLESFVRDKQLRWPQYFDGKGWSNAISRKFGIAAIPTLWLVDQEGHVVDRRVRGRNLQKKVERLLADPPEDSASPPDGRPAEKRG